MRAGLAVRPATPAAALIEALTEVPALSLALVMTVEPGFGGQPFRADQLAKVAAVRAACAGVAVQVDGGLDAETTGPAADAGATVVVAGTAVFGAPDARAAIAALRARLEGRK